MVKFLHTSDWQMGMRAVHAGLKAKDVRDIRFDSASRVVALAKENNVDFVVMAGDTFEHHDVDDVVVKRTVDVLNQFAPITVYVLPGNHDPYLPGGVWERESWKRADSHVKLCNIPEEMAFSAEVAIFPCPLTQKQSAMDPTDWIPQRSVDDRRVRIGIAHGALDVLPDTVNFPISKERPDLSGLDYLALGDWHSHLRHGRAVYSGTMEPTSFSERDPGYAIVVDIPSYGAEPELIQHKTRSLTWSQFKPSIRDITDVESLDRSIKDLGPLESLLLRIEPIFDAETSEQAVERIQTLREEVEESAFLVEWQVDVEALSDLGMPAALPAGYLQSVDEALLAILEGRIPEGLGHKFASEEHSVVQEAKGLLHRIVRGGNS